MSLHLNLSECAQALSCELHGEDVLLSGISIDSRTLAAGDLYIAIVGEVHDGHDFVEAAETAGAAALLVEKPAESGLPQLIVDNTRQALGAIAAYWARRFTIPTVAVTGSNGKTTVKEMVASILQQQGPVLATSGNLNNDIGVPLTLLRMRQHHQYAVLELGANHVGEIAYLVSLVDPLVAVVNNVGTAHLEGFGSVEGIARGKSEIYAGLDSDGYAVINADDAFADVMRAAAKHCRIREFGIHSDADIKGLPGPSPTVETMGQQIELNLQLTGEHNFRNALAAIAAAQCLDISAEAIRTGLEAVGPVPGRLQFKSGLHGAQLIDDTYNANPDSAESAVSVLAGCAGQKFLVLGDMAELGPEAPEMHRRIGVLARQKGIDRLWTIGELSENAQIGFLQNSGGESVDEQLAESAPESADHYVDKQQLLDSLKPCLQSDLTILFKGSRSARMEELVQGLCAEPESEAGDTSGVEEISA